MRKFITLLCITVLAGCSAQKKISYLMENSVSAGLSPSFKSEMPEVKAEASHRDTLRVTGPSGESVIIMKAIRDEEGEMVAHDVIEAAVVQARFRNVAERNGKVDIAFDITVPKSMQDSKWQIRLYPTIEVLGDTSQLSPVIITGRDYRKGQLRGYQQYQRFLESIITDSTRFLRQKDLEHFLKRNLPEIYRFKTDSSLVSDEQFTSSWGITQRQAVEHYTSRMMIRRNDSRSSRKQKMYSKYVKVPIVTEGIRLDTVMKNSDGDFIYEYVQRITAEKGLRKVDVTLEGDIYEQQNIVFRIPQSQPLTFYISSLSTLTDNTERYLTKVIERRAETSTVCLIEFGTGKSDIDPSLSDNSSEISRIRQNLVSLLENEEFEMDSIVVKASCSPEGRYAFNRTLSQKRAQSVSDYFGDFLKQRRDSLKREEGIRIDLSGSIPESTRQKDIVFISRSIPENWDNLERLISLDTLISQESKEYIKGILGENDPDQREALLSKDSSFEHISQDIYPKLRTVNFAFHLHRKGMVKDTIHTTVIDTVYMEGVQAIRDRDYQRAATLLRPYRDFNSAIAFCCLEYNATALDILKDLKSDDKTEYMMALLYSREGDDNSAVQHYLNACELNPSFVHRGNLDPEISELIRRYDLKVGQQDDEDLEYL